MHRKQEEFLHKEIKDAERQVQQAKYRANDHLLKFGDWMPRLVDAINVAVCEGKFMKPPRGPIGEIEMLDEIIWIWFNYVLAEI